MKRLIIIFSCFCLFFLLMLAVIRPIAVIVAENQLKKVFVKARIFVSGCAFKPPFGLGLSGIRITRQGAYDIRVKQAAAQIVLKNGSLKVFLLVPEVYFNTSGISMSGAQMENTRLEFNFGSGQGQFSIPFLKYDKLSVTDFQGNLQSQGKVLTVSGSAQVLNGNIKLDLSINKQAQYLISAGCANLDIEKFVRDFNLRDRFDMTGTLSGSLKLKGEAGKMEVLEGSLSTLPPGGTLVITDTKFLENMAVKTNQPASLLVESFKDYRYNTGLMNLGLEAGNVVLKISLEGDAGKRDLSVMLHDFNLRRQGQ